MPIDQRRAIVRAETLIAFEPFQSTEETRYYLNGTCIRSTKDGPVLIATDGHTLIVMRDPEAHVSGLDTVWNCGAKARLGNLLTKVRKQPGVGRDQPRDLWVDLQYGSPGAPTMTARVAESVEEIMSGGGEPQLMITDRSLYVDGSFPQYDRVFPKRPPGQGRFLPRRRISSEWPIWPRRWAAPAAPRCSARRTRAARRSSRSGTCPTCGA